MPETRCTKVYKDGILIGEEDCREVSDEELQVEQIEQETAEANDQALAAYLNFDNLSAVQRKLILKALLGDFISRNRTRYIGVL